MWTQFSADNINFDYIKQHLIIWYQNNELFAPGLTGFVASDASVHANFFHSMQNNLDGVEKQRFSILTEKMFEKLFDKRMIFKYEWSMSYQFLHTLDQCFSIGGLRPTSILRATETNYLNWWISLKNIKINFGKPEILSRLRVSWIRVSVGWED